MRDVKNDAGDIAALTGLLKFDANQFAPNSSRNKFRSAAKRSLVLISRFVGLLWLAGVVVVMRENSITGTVANSVLRLLHANQAHRSLLLWYACFALHSVAKRGLAGSANGHKWSSLEKPVVSEEMTTNPSWCSTSKKMEGISRARYWRG